MQCCDAGADDTAARASPTKSGTDIASQRLWGHKEAPGRLLDDTQGAPRGVRMDLDMMAPRETALLWDAGSMGLHPDPAPASCFLIDVPPKAWLPKLED